MIDLPPEADKVINRRDDRRHHNEVDRGNHYKRAGYPFNFDRIAPHGIIFAQFFSTSPLTGITDYPLACAGAGTTMAVGGSLSALGPGTK